MFRCAPAPDVPTNERLSEPDGDTALSVYITRLDMAHKDCEETLTEAGETLEIMGLTVTDTRPEPEPVERVTVWDRLGF